MSRSTFFRNTTLLLLLIMITACSARDRNESTNPTERVEAPTPDGPSTGSGLCTNSYYPIHEGATWTYKSTVAISGDYEFTETITQVRKDGFTVTSQVGD